MRAAALTMVHTELDYLGLWLRHYEQQFGRENLYVVAHGSDPAVVALAKGCNIVPLPRHRVSGSFDKDRFAFLNAYADFLLTQYDGVVAGDVDEIVFVDPALGLSLPEYMAQNRHQGAALKAFCLNIVEEQGAAPLDLTRPILGQRRHARANELFSKPLVVFDRPGWSVGFHSTPHPPCLPDGLFVAHLHYASRRICEEIALSRSTTLAENPDIRRGHDHTTQWWAERLRKFDAYVEKAASFATAPLDQVIDDYRETLRATVIDSQWLRHKTLGFPSRPKIRLELPERFAQAF